MLDGKAARESVKGGREAGRYLGLATQPSLLGESLANESPYLKTRQVMASEEKCPKAALRPPHAHTCTHTYTQTLTNREGQQRATSEKVLNAELRCLMNVTDAIRDSAERMTCPTHSILSEDSLGIQHSLPREGTQERKRGTIHRRQESEVMCPRISSSECAGFPQQMRGGLSPMGGVFRVLLSKSLLSREQLPCEVTRSEEEKDTVSHMRWGEG